MTKVGDVEVARTGLCTTQAEEGGYDYRTELIESSTRAGYYPGAAPIHVKIITERGSGLLLGAQIVGGPGSGKRIDVFATAIWAGSFEQVNFFPTFFITPLTFLGGVFYSIEMLPPALRGLTTLNPIFYLVDGVRFGMLGISDAPPWAGVILLCTLAGTAVAGSYAMLRSGYKLRG